MRYGAQKREKRKDSIMPHLTTILLGAAVILFISPAAAQNAPATFRADPSVYKLLYEDQNIRVISATWAKGVHDKLHSHPIPSVAYARLYPPALRARRHDERHHQQGWLGHGGTHYALAHC
jgi:hypothetical protein